MSILQSITKGLDVETKDPAEAIAVDPVTNLADRAGETMSQTNGEVLQMDAEDFSYSGSPGPVNSPVHANLQKCSPNGLFPSREALIAELAPFALSKPVI